MPGKTKASGRERQSSIIAAAAFLFAQKGFNGTTTREIAKTAGISEALLFRYFPTKRALYSAIIAAKSQLSHLLASVEEAADKRDDVRVFTLIAGFRGHRGSDSSLLRLLLFSALEGHELSDLFFRKRHRVFYEFLAGYIAQRMREGAFRKVDPLLAAQSFIGMVVYHRLLHDIFSVPPHCSPEGAVRGFVDVFLEGLLNKRAGESRAGRRP